MACDPVTQACRDGACGDRCAEGEDLCNERCVDTRTSPHHCGGCNNRCPIDQDCAEGECVLSCSISQARCGGECVRIDRDPRHCGGCDQACDAHLVCRDSRCICEDLALTECEDVCVDTQATQEHCGGCGQACPDDQVCVEGECTCEIEGWGVCDGRCVDLRNDVAHCGECGSACEPDVECRYGNCGLPELLEGVQLDMPEDELIERGWTRCWQGLYGLGGQQAANIRNQILSDCDGPMLVLACRPLHQANLSVLAMGMREDVLRDQGQNRAGRHDANGVGWYFSDQWSWGFGPAGQPVSRNSCDTNQAVPEERLCWHTSGGAITSGYRCGRTTLNGNNGWERLIYHVGD